MPLFDGASDEYTQLVITSQEKLKALTPLEMAAQPLFEGASDGYTQRVLSSIDTVFTERVKLLELIKYHKRESLDFEEDGKATSQAFLNLIQSCQNEKLPEATREALTHLKFSLNLTTFKRFKVGAFHSLRLDGMNFSGLDLSGLDLTRISMKGTNFSNANLHKVLMFFPKIHNVIFTGANLSDAIITWGEIHNSDLSNTNLTNTVFNRMQFFEDTIFDGACLSKTRFGNVDMNTVDLSKAFEKDQHTDQELLEIYQAKESEALSAAYTFTSKNKEATQSGIGNSVSSDKQDKSVSSVEIDKSVSPDNQDKSVSSDKRDESETCTVM